MKRTVIAVLVTCIIMFVFGCQESEVHVKTAVNEEAEKAVIEEVVKNSIGWAKDKDTTLLYNCFAHDENLFWFNPEAGSFTLGIENFRQTVENVFMNDAFQAVRFEVKEMRINLSQNGDVAWYSCILDDENTWAGQPASWLNVRWTGVLEKLDGRWQIVQMHFSNGIGPDGKADYGTAEDKG